tara:strand:+ start:1053 stop:1598 length:546 start_codon:yes stop_codon:yes gene_type:complete
MKEFDPFVVSTVHKYDVDRVLLEWERIESDIAWYTSNDGSKQSSLQYDPNADEDMFLGGCGSFLNTSKVESNYDTIVPLYRGTIFEEIISDLNGVRARFMMKRMHTTYSLHKDKANRYHMALITNPHAYMFFPNAPDGGLRDSKTFSIPADGVVYETRTTSPHTVFNCGEDRTHLVISKRS